MNAEREQYLRIFLERAGWSDAKRAPIAGDASARRYERLIKRQPNRSAILMDAPIKEAGNLTPFVEIADFLKETGLSAPTILAQDLDHGFLLLEDLGDALFTREIMHDPTRERPLYEAAVNAIHKIHAAPAPKMPRYGAQEMAHATDLAFLHYRSTTATQLEDDAQLAINCLHELLSQCEDFGAVSLRDFHAENLLWLESRSGVQRVGLLDFQDAVLTHPAYDLVSLLRDARRDVSPDLTQDLINQFAQTRGFEREAFAAEAALIAVQRNLRILGIFARLSRKMGKPHYVDLVPRVWHHLQTDLAHPALKRLKRTLDPILPEPTTDLLNRLRTE